MYRKLLNCMLLENVSSPKCQYNFSCLQTLSMTNYANLVPKQLGSKNYTSPMYNVKKVVAAFNRLSLQCTILISNNYPQCTGIINPSNVSIFSFHLFHNRDKNELVNISQYFFTLKMDYIKKLQSIRITSLYNLAVDTVQAFQATGYGHFHAWNISAVRKKKQNTQISTSRQKKILHKHIITDGERRSLSISSHKKSEKWNIRCRDE